MGRICVYPKDISQKLGIGTRKAQRLLNEIKKYLNKDKHQYVTLREFCKYTGIPQEDMEL